MKWGGRTRYTPFKCTTHIIVSSHAIARNWLPLRRLHVQQVCSAIRTRKRNSQKVAVMSVIEWVLLFQIIQHITASSFSMLIRVMDAIVADWYSFTIGFPTVFLINKFRWHTTWGGCGADVYFVWSWKDGRFFLFSAALFTGSTQQAQSHSRSFLGGPWP